MAAPVPSPGAKVQRLFMALIIATAKGDKDKVFAIAQELLEEFEKGLEVAKSGSKGKRKKG